jgi:glycosyltransferase involved in cell wall biosynthesis
MIAPPMRVSIVVPVYNSTVLAELAERVEAVFRERPGDSWELIFVDDASPDPAVWPQLERLARERPEVQVHQLTRNFGQPAATLCGLRAATGDWVATLDDDLQHRPEDLPALLAESGHDIVIGQFARREHGLGKRLASRLKGVFDRVILGKPRGVRLSSFRLLSRTVVEGVLAIRTPYPFLPALMFYVSRDVVGVEVRHEPRREGRSGYTLWKQIALFSNLLISNSSLVLRVVGQMGIALALVSFALALAVAWRKLVHGIPVQGWASLFTALLLLGGLILFSLGVIGEYLIRIIESSEARPTYFVRRRLNAAEGLQEEPGPAARETALR